MSASVWKIHQTKKNKNNKIAWEERHVRQLFVCTNMWETESRLLWVVSGEQQQQNAPNKNNKKMNIYCIMYTIYINSTGNKKMVESRKQSHHLWSCMRLWRSASMWNMTQAQLHTHTHTSHTNLWVFRCCASHIFMDELFSIQLLHDCNDCECLAQRCLSTAVRNGIMFKFMRSSIFTMSKFGNCQYVNFKNHLLVIVVIDTLNVKTEYKWLEFLVRDRH